MTLVFPKSIFSISIRRVLVLAALLLPVAACSSSKDTADSDDAQSSDRVEQQLAAIDQAVGLTDDQALRIREILDAAEAARPTGPPSGGRRGGRAGGANARGGREARQADLDRQIEATLTEEQVEAYRAWRAAQPQPQRRGGRRGGQPTP